MQIHAVTVRSENFAVKKRKRFRCDAQVCGWNGTIASILSVSLRLDVCDFAVELRERFNSSTTGDRTGDENRSCAQLNQLTLVLRILPAPWKPPEGRIKLLADKDI